MGKSGEKLKKDIDIIKKKINNLSFFRQKIYSKIDNTQEEYELLLRYNINGKYIFPEQLFDILMTDHECHKLYIQKIDQILTRILEKDNCVYSLNIDYQELFYSDTIHFLEKLSHKDRLKIELTERIPLVRSNAYSELFPIETIKSLKKMGYVIVLDDFLSGINSLSSLIILEPWVSRIKFSTLDFKNILCTEQLLNYLLSMESIIKKFNKEIVIEGVEEIKLLQSFPKEWKQQSYYYNIPHKFY